MTKIITLYSFIIFTTYVLGSEQKNQDYRYWDQLAEEIKSESDSLYHIYTSKAYALCPTGADDYLELSLQFAGSSLIISDLDTSLSTLESVFKQVEKENDPVLLGRYYYIKAAIQLRRGLFVPAEANALLAVKHFGSHSADHLAQVYNLLSAIYFRLNKTKKSLETLLKVPALYPNNSQNEQLGKAYNNMGNVYISIGEKRKALTFYKLSVQIDEKLKNYSSLLSGYNNIGLAYNAIGDLDSASYFFKKVITDSNNYSNSVISSKAYLNLGIVYLNQTDNLSAIKAFKKSKKICEYNDDQVGVILALINMGEVYTNAGNYRSAENQLTEALKKSKQIKADRYLEAIYERLVEVNFQRKDYKQAFEYQSSYIALKDSMYDEVEVRVLENLESKYEKERALFQDSLDLVRQNNLLALTQEKRMQELENEQNIRNLLSICLLFSGGMFFLLYSKYRAEKKSNAIIDSTNEELKKTLISKEEKELLLKEIHHRVKNNLQIISSLMRLQSNTTANLQLKANYQEMQDRINSMALVHEQLYGSNDFSTIQVIEYANRLVDRVQRVYSGGEVEIIKKIEIKEMTIETLIPLGLLVNELLTNCFKYAVNGEGSKITIVLSNTMDGKYLKIEDNGPGVDDIDAVFNKGTFGAELFKTLVEQLDGTYAITSEKGFKVEVFF
jgi:two-component sensor histidine kinase